MSSPRPMYLVCLSSTCMHYEDNTPEGMEAMCRHIEREHPEIAQSFRVRP